MDEDEWYADTLAGRMEALGAEAERIASQCRWPVSWLIRRHFRAKHEGLQDLIARRRNEVLSRVFPEYDFDREPD